MKPNISNDERLTKQADQVSRKFSRNIFFFFHFREKSLNNDIYIKEKKTLENNKINFLIYFHSSDRIKTKMQFKKITVIYIKKKIRIITKTINVKNKIFTRKKT